MVPRPLHSGQVDQVAPGAPPEPVQVGQVSVTCRLTGTFPPSVATRNGTSTRVSMASACGSSCAAAPEDRREDVAQPAEIAEIHSLGLSGPGHPPPPVREPAPVRGPRAALPSNAPSRRIWSYCFRFSASESTLCASEISLKRSAAAGLFGLASGWYCLASRRYAFLISA